MTERAIFNRKYTSYNAGGTEVWLVSGAGVTTESTSVITLTAGQSLIQGDFVRISGVYAVKASAASGLAVENSYVVGATTEAASQGSPVDVSTDGVVIVSSTNLAGLTSLVPGQQYYLSKYFGQIAPYSGPSGLITNSGTNQHQALVPIGKALSTTELDLEIQPGVTLYE